MKKILSVAIALLMGYTVTNCTSDLEDLIPAQDDPQIGIQDESESDDQSQNPGDDSDTTDDPYSGKTTYYGNVEPLLNQLCVSCHNTVIAEDGLDISSYQKAKSEIDEILESLYEDEDDIMPPSGRISDSLIQVFIDWKIDGLLEGDPNSNEDNNDNTSGIYTYIDDIGPILAQECTACHNASNPLGGYDISTYSKTVAGIDLLIQRIDLQTGQTGIMPPNGRMTESTIQKIKDWYEQGLVEQ